MGGYTTNGFNGSSSSGGAGFQSHRGKKGSGWFKKFMSGLLAATALCGAMGVNYLYQDFKGADSSSASSFNKASIAAADALSLWGGLFHRPVNALPDHVQVCIPNSIAEKLKHAEPGSPLARYIGEIEDHARGVAARHAEPGKSYGENEYHNGDFYGHWFLYANEGEEKLYENGQRPAAPIYAQSYSSTQITGMDCGNTNGHAEGSKNYNQASHYVTHDGTKIPVPK